MPEARGSGRSGRCVTFGMRPCASGPREWPFAPRGARDRGVIGVDRRKAIVTPDSFRGPLCGEGDGWSLLRCPRRPVDPGTSPG
ncbi:hypothetical protein WR25_18101 [Diploscapter pachys]|uniref:Uncharacterized protein n=1 Tax=Diploscapter pachys TaxID=2018661 RepID=A0A2A2M4A9_9BILA|nr:hypothetical protein WR25_18101 [Diploscapter pachys]